MGQSDVTNNQGIFSEGFLQASKDLLFLLERKYPPRKSVQLTGDRYRLNSVQRSILRRGVLPLDTALERKKKLLSREQIFGRILSVDSCNVIAALGNYLTGAFVYIAADGIVRDAAESSGIFRNSTRRIEAVRIIGETLPSLHPGLVRFYIDEPITHSRDLAAEIHSVISSSNIEFEVKPVLSADRVLKNSDGILVSGDSEIIDCAKEVFDLSRYALERKFGAELPDLGSFLQIPEGGGLMPSPEMVNREGNNIPSG